MSSAVVEPVVAGAQALPWGAIIPIAFLAVFVTLWSVGVITTVIRLVTGGPKTVDSSGQMQPVYDRLFLTLGLLSLLGLTAMPIGLWFQELLKPPRPIGFEKLFLLSWALMAFFSGLNMLVRLEMSLKAVIYEGEHGPLRMLGVRSAKRYRRHPKVYRVLHIVGGIIFTLISAAILLAFLADPYNFLEPVAR